MEECIWGKGFLETYFSANNKAGISIFSLALTVFHVDEILKNSIARKHVEFRRVLPSFNIGTSVCIKPAKRQGGRITDYQQF